MTIECKMVLLFTQSRNDLIKIQIFNQVAKQMLSKREIVEFYCLSKQFYSRQNLFFKGLKNYNYIYFKYFSYNLFDLIKYNQLNALH